MSEGILVTGFYDLSRHGDRGVRTWPFYRDNGRWLMELGLPMVVFIDREHEDEMRSLYPRSNIRWRPIVESDFEMHRRNEIADILKARGAADWKGTPEYFLVSRKKTAWLREAAELASEQSRFYWVDFGIAYVKNFPDDESADVLRHMCTKDGWHPGITACAIDYIPPDVRGYRDKYYGKDWWPMASGFFGGVKRNVESLARQFEAEWQQVVRDGYIPFDERIHGWLMYNSTLYTKPHYGNHASCIANRYGAKYDRELVIFMSGRARYFHDTDEADARFDAAAETMTPADWACSAY